MTKGKLFFNDYRHLMHLQGLPQSLIMFFLEVAAKAAMFISLLLWTPQSEREKKPWFIVRLLHNVASLFPH